MDEVFHLKAPFQPTGDQPQAIEALVQGIHEVKTPRRCWRHRLRQDVYDGEHHRPVQSPDADFGAE